MGFTTPGLFHFNGTAGSTVYPNDSDSGLTFSNIPSGIAALLTSDSVFGGAALENGADNALGGLISNRKVWLNGDFTIKVRFRTANNAFLGTVFSIGDVALNPRALHVRLNSAATSAGDIRVFLGTTQLIASAAASITNGVWEAIMVEKIGNVLYLALDGAFAGCALCPGPIGGGYIVIGNYFNNGSYDGLGSSYLLRHDEFQLTDGLARHVTLPYALETAEFRRDGRKSLTSVQLRRRRMDMFNMMGSAVAVANANASHTDLSTTQAVTVGAVASANASRTDLSTTQVVTVSTQASITWLQTSAAQFADNTTSFTPTISGITAGQLLVLTVSQENTGLSTTQSPAIATPSGWSVAVANAGAIATVARTGLNSQAIFYKIATGTSDSATITSGTNAYWNGEISAWSYSGTLALSTTNHAENTGTATSINSGSVTPASAVSLVVAVANATSSGAMSALAGPTSGYTQLRLTADNNTHTDHASGYKILSSASAQSGGFTWTTASYASAAIASFTATMVSTANADASHTDLSTTQVVTVGAAASAGVNLTLASTTQNVTVGSRASASGSHTDLGTTQAVTVASTAGANASHTDLSTTQVATAVHVFSANASHTDLSTTQAVTVVGVASASGTHTDLGTTQVVTVAQVVSVNASHTDLSTTQVTTANHGGANANASHTDLSTTQAVTVAQVGSASGTHTDLSTTQAVTLASVTSANASHTDLGTTQAVNVGHGGVANANASHTDLSTTQVVTVGMVARANASHTDLSTTQVAIVTSPPSANASHTDLGTTQVVTVAHPAAANVNASHTDLPTTQVATAAGIASASGTHTDLPTTQVVTAGARAVASVNLTLASTTQVTTVNHGGANASGSHTDLSTTQVVTLLGYNGVQVNQLASQTSQVVNLRVHGTITVNRLQDSTTQVVRLGVNLEYRPSDTEVFILPEERWVIVGVN